MSPAAQSKRKGPQKPTWRLVRSLFAEGYELVGGLDEVGRGAWAGPVSVGIVVVQAHCLRKAPSGVRDSKLLAEAARELLFEPLRAWCPAAAVGEASPQECDELGMTAAQKLAARRALEQLSLQPEVLVVDGKWDYTGHPGARAVIDADASCFPVAAASVLAKVTRDRQMIAHAPYFPAYGFERNKGYASCAHRAAVAEHGMSPLHRRSWSVWYGAAGEGALGEDESELELTDDESALDAGAVHIEGSAALSSTSSAITVDDGGHPRPAGRGVQRARDRAPANRG